MPEPRKFEWTLTERIFLAVIDLAPSDSQAKRLFKRHYPNTLVDYAESVVKNPNQTQIAQRLYAHAIAERIEGK